MKDSNVSRRKFNKLTAAAITGLVAGTVTGCPSGDAPPPAAPPPPSNGGSGTSGTDPDTGTEVAANPLLSEPHVCRGLNTCKGNGAGADNACAGQGACASVEAHDCATLNTCKGQGGCGASPGENACKGKGGCAVPLNEQAWEKARKKFEELMQTAGKEVGAAPAKS